MLNTANLPPLPTLLVSEPVSDLEILLLSVWPCNAHNCTTTTGHIPKHSGPYNPVASLPLKVVKNILNLEFVEMSELRAIM